MKNHEGVIIIAGASKGLGRELAYSFLENNYSVALIARHSNELQDLHKTLKTKYPQQIISVHPTDLTDAEKTSQSFNDIVKDHKKIRALINCAATWTGGKSVKQLSSEDMHQSILKNFFVAFNPIKAMLDLPSDAICKPSAIVNVGATASLRGSKNCAAFAVGKGALRQLSQSLAREMGSENIHVSHVIVDGLLANTRTKELNKSVADNKFMNMTSVANSILHVIEQDPSCWTFEWDLRPYNETW